jgi:soluble lytic murein transglycosylase-like protein
MTALLLSVAIWRALIAQAADRYDVPADLIEAIIAVESGGNPRAVGPAGEQGLMQILPSTGRRLGLRDGFDPAQNIDAGTRYLGAELRACGGDVACAIAGYNGGPRARTAPLPSTRRYVALVLARRRAPAPPVVPVALQRPPVVPTSPAVLVQASTVLMAPGSRLAASAREE